MEMAMASSTLLKAFAIDLSNNVYVADSANQRIQRFTSSGTFVSSFGVSGHRRCVLIHPRAWPATPLAIFMCPTPTTGSKNMIPAGNFILFWGEIWRLNWVKFKYPYGLAMDLQNYVIYVADYGKQTASRNLT